MAIPLLLLLLLREAAAATSVISPAQSTGPYPNVDAYLLVDVPGHAVHCLETADGGFVAVGNVPEVGPGGGNLETAQDGFVLKVAANGTVLFNKRFAEGNQKWDGMLAVAEARASAGSYLLLAGWKWTGARYDRYLVKLSAAGDLIWETTFAGEGSGAQIGSSGFEMINLAANGDAVLSGFVDGAPTMSLEFKSGGNPDQCACGVMKFAASAMDAGTAPSKAAAAFDVVVQGMAIVPNRPHELQSPVSGTSVRALSDGGAIVASRTVNDTLDAADISHKPPPTLVRLSNTGAQLWVTIVPGSWGEVTDLAVAPDESYFITSGHGTDPAVGGLDGRFARVSVADGAVAWITYHGDNRSLIYDECWGIAFVNDTQGAGALAFCGTGIEPGNCPATNTTAWAEMEQEEKDTCEGPTAFGDKWKNLNIRIDAADGSLVWKRVDQYYPAEPEMDFTFENAATEYGALTADGGSLLVADMDSGVGFLKLAPLSSGGGPGTPVASGPSSPPTPPTPPSPPPPPPTPPEQPSPSPSPPASNNVGGIVGGAVGGSFGGIVFLSWIGWLIYKKKGGAGTKGEPPAAVGAKQVDVQMVGATAEPA